MHDNVDTNDTVKGFGFDLDTCLGGSGFAGFASVSVGSCKAAFQRSYIGDMECEHTPCCITETAGYMS